MKLLKYRFVLYLSLIVLLSSCQKYNNPVPNVPVEKNLNINLPSYSTLQGVSGWIYIDGGAKGIIVYRKNLDEFIAIERHGSYDIDNSCDPVYVDSSNALNIIDPCSESTYSMLDGTVTHGPAEYPLRQYNTYFNSASNQLRIYN